jgi:hypothetical protein
VVGRIFKANASPVGTPWMWTLAFGHHEDRMPTHGYAENRETRPDLSIKRKNLDVTTRTNRDGVPGRIRTCDLRIRNPLLLSS